MKKLSTLCFLICFAISFSQEKYAKYNQTVSSVESNMILNLANIEHDPKESVNLDLNEIDYDWQA